MKHKPSLSCQFGDIYSLSGAVLTGMLQEVVGLGYPFRFSARGSSMTPFIRDGDVLTIRPYPNVRPRMGDVAAIIHPVSQQLLVHRVVGRKSDSYITQGDNTSETDGLIPESHILGALASIERNGARVRFGLGVERFFIAALVRIRLLHPLVFFLQAITPAGKSTGS